MADPTENIEITYSGGDILAVNIAAWRFWLWLVAFMAVLLYWVPIILALVDGYSVGEAIEMVDLKFSCIILFAVLAWIILVVVFGYWWRSRKGLLGPISFALSSEGVSFRNQKMNGLVFWSAIKSIRTKGNRTFLFISRRSAFIFPRRAFETETDFRAFTATAQDYWSAAR